MGNRLNNSRISISESLSKPDKLNSWLIAHISFSAHSASRATNGSGREIQKAFKYFFSCRAHRAFIAFIEFMGFLNATNVSNSTNSINATNPTSLTKPTRPTNMSNFKA